MALIAERFRRWHPVPAPAFPALNPPVDPFQTLGSFRSERVPRCDAPLQSIKERRFAQAGALLDLDGAGLIDGGGGAELLRDDAGTFGLESDVPGVGILIHALASADFDGGGILDAVASGRAHTAPRPAQAIGLLGVRSGGFTPQPEIDPSVPWSAGSLRCATREIKRN